MLTNCLYIVLILYRIGGTVNGIGQSFAAIGRFLGPSIGSTCFAWSQNAQLPWPCNFHLTFYTIGLCFLLSWCAARTLPVSIEKAKVVNGHDKLNTHENEEEAHRRDGRGDGDTSTEAYASLDVKEPGISNDSEDGRESSEPSQTRPRGLGSTVGIL